MKFEDVMWFLEFWLNTAINRKSKSPSLSHLVVVAFSRLTCYWYCKRSSSSIVAKSYSHSMRLASRRQAIDNIYRAVDCLPSKFQQWNFIQNVQWISLQSNVNENDLLQSCYAYCSVLEGGRHTNGQPLALVILALLATWLLRSSNR